MYNVQHDCPLAKCTASGTEQLTRERVLSDSVGSCVRHNPIERFVVNTHAFHNAHRLREALDRSLIAPIPLYPAEMRKAKHIEMAQSLRATQKAKVQARGGQKNQDTHTMASVIPAKRMRSNPEAEESVSNLHHAGSFNV